jgi:hypothetical protein
MSQVHGVQCNALCGASILWATERGEHAPTKAEMEKEARRRGWNAPDKLGRHWCPEHRRPDGRKKASDA